MKKDRKLFAKEAMRIHEEVQKECLKKDMNCILIIVKNDGTYETVFPNCMRPNSVIATLFRSASGMAQMDFTKYLKKYDK